MTQTTIYITQEQALSAQKAIEELKKDGWIIEGVEIVIPEGGGGCWVNLDDDITYKFLFRFAMKTGYILCKG